MAAYVVDEQNVDAQWENGVESRLTIDGRLQQRVLRFGPGPAVREPGERYELRGPLLAVSVTAAATGAERERVVSRFADRPEERADEQRTFRVLHQGDLTQFVGIVQPCRAPDHSHPYDEVGFILEGRGFAHVAGDSTAIGPGFCFHLPPNEVHCIENSGPGVMRILGVFYPSGSPKQRG